MKKTLFLITFMALAAYSFANEELNRSIFIDGRADRRDHLEFFYINFRSEAIGMGIPLAETRNEAGFIFNFSVKDNDARNVDGNQFDLRISLINASDNHEILFFNFYFNSLDELYEHIQSLFFRAVSVIPPLTEDALFYANTAWKHKWLYLRASFDYPLSIYRLQPDGLFNGIAVYGDISNNEVSDLDHKLIFLPGFTIGAEFQFLDFMSFEVNLKGFLGNFETNFFLNLAAQAQLKFPIKYFRSFVISPYIGGLIPIYTSNIFSDYPLFAAGGGIQVNFKGGINGAVFLDVNYMHSFQDAVRINPYKTLFPNPSGIHYRPFFVGLGIGYKYGFFDRPRRPTHTPPENIIFIEVPSSGEGAADPNTRSPGGDAPSSRTFYF